MLKAIIYQSATDHTHRYAQLLSKAINLPDYNRSDPNIPLAKDDKVIYLGWVRTAKIQGLKKVQKNHTLAAICAVGMEPHQGNQRVKKLGEKNHTGETPLYYAQGGYDRSKQKTLHKFLMTLFYITLKNPKLTTKSETQAQIIRKIIKNSEDYVSTQNITELITWAKTQLDEKVNL